MPIEPSFASQYAFEVTYSAPVVLIRVAKEASGADRVIVSSRSAVSSMDTMPLR